MRIPLARPAYFSAEKLLRLVPVALRKILQAVSSHLLLVLNTMNVFYWLIYVISIISLLIPGGFWALAVDLPTKVLFDVPFTAQAPRGNWRDPRQQAGCEEAVVLMAMRWARGKSLSVAQAEAQIKAMAAWQKKQYGGYVDTSAADTAERLVKGYAGYEKVEVRYDIGVEDIKNELRRGNVAIVPVNGRLLKNPFFTRLGPLYHMLLIRGYDDKKREFITNDPGTRRGNGYRYSYDVLMNAMRDYPTGDHEEIKSVRKAMIVVSR